MGALSKGYNDTPEKASRPYDANREDFVKNYKEGLDYIIELNKKGIFFIEGYACGGRFTVPYELSFRMSFQHHDDGGFGVCLS